MSLLSGVQNLDCSQKYSVGRFLVPSDLSIDKIERQVSIVKINRIRPRFNKKKAIFEKRTLFDNVKSERIDKSKKSDV